MWRITFTDAGGSAKLVEGFTSSFFLPTELSDVNPIQFSSPEVYRLSHIPLIDPNTQEMMEAYYEPTFVDAVVSSGENVHGAEI
jgi:hypothetical protein